jgi:hypothetical protein
MSETSDTRGSTGSEAAPTASSLPASLPTVHPTDQPIPLWPEGVLVVLAGVTLVVIGLRHRLYIQRKVQECQRMMEEFQRQGGMEDLAHVARQASELLKGAEEDA